MSPNIRFRRTLLLCKTSHFAQLPKCSGLCANKTVTFLWSRVPSSLPHVSYHKGCAFSRCFFSTRGSDVCPIFSCEFLLKCSLFYWKPTSSIIQKPSQILLVKVFSFPCVPMKYDCLSIIILTCARVTFDLSISAERLWASGGQSPCLIQLHIPPTKKSSASRS